jgi:2-hydroxy-3-keto-5-methylthiopentenyl-1-phosphate phosphatase
MTEKISPSHIPAGILVSDFDGTITRHDFYDLACKEFPAISTQGFWQQYEKGRITHFEALRLIFASIRTDESRLLRILEDMEIEPEFSKSVSMLEKNGWKVVIASGGCDWYIRRLLKEQGVSVPVYANPGEFYPEKGLQMSLPGPSPFFSASIGVDKVAVVRDALEKSGRVAFAGDGRPDLAPALLVPPEMRFAKSWLAKHLSETGEGFRSFENWAQVAEALVKERH